MLRKVFERISVDLLVEPLSELVEKRLKAAWSKRPCPLCGSQGTIKTWEGCERVRCQACGFYPRYTSGTPFAHKELADGKLLLIFVLHLDTLLSTRAIARLFDHDYHTIHDAVTDFETAFVAGVPQVWAAIKPCVGGPTQVDETPQVCSGFTGQEPPREGLSGKAQLIRVGAGGAASRVMS